MPEKSQKHLKPATFDGWMPEWKGLTTYKARAEALDGMVQKNFAMMEKIVADLKGWQKLTPEEAPEVADRFHQALDMLHVAEAHANRADFALQFLSGIRIHSPVQQKFLRDGREQVKAIHQMIGEAVELLPEIPRDAREAMVNESPAMGRKYGEYIFSENLPPAQEKPEKARENTITYQGDEKAYWNVFQEAFRKREKPLDEDMKIRIGEALTRMAQQMHRKTDGDFAAFYEKDMGWIKEARESWLDGQASLPKDAEILPSAEVHKRVDAMRYSWEEMQDIVVTAYRNFHPQLGELAQCAFDEGWIHPIKNRDTSTAGFSMGYGQINADIWTGATPRIYMPFTGGNFNVVAMAHELGHAMNSYLHQSGLQTPVKECKNQAVKEVIAHVGEHLAVEEMWRRKETPEEKTDLMRWYAYRENALLEKHGSQALEKLVEGLEGRTTPYSFEEALAAFDRNDGEGAVEKADISAIFSAPYLMSGWPLLDESYAAAVLGARAFAHRYFNEDAATKKEMAETWVGQVMTFSHDYDWSQAMEAVGLDPRSDDFIAKPKALYEQRRDEVMRPEQLGKFATLIQRQIAQKQEEAARGGGRAAA